MIGEYEKKRYIMWFEQAVNPGVYINMKLNTFEKEFAIFIEFN